MSGRGPAPEPAWPRDPEAAMALQRELAARVVEADAPGPSFRRVAGVDVHFSAAGDVAFGAVAALERAGPGEPAELEESVLLAAPVAFPYRPGFLSFREAPAALAAIARLSRPPDLLMVDGHGRAHPRRLGIAAHIGVLLDLPAVGVAKSVLVGRHAEPGPAKGDRAPLVHRGEVVGVALRTREGASPVYVSVGHRVGLEGAVRAVLELGGRTRLPEPTRIADRLSRAHG